MPSAKPVDKPHRTESSPAADTEPLKKSVELNKQSKSLLHKIVDQSLGATARGASHNPYLDLGSFDSAVQFFPDSSFAKEPARNGPPAERSGILEATSGNVSSVFLSNDVTRKYEHDELYSMRDRASISETKIEAIDGFNKEYVHNTADKPARRFTSYPPPTVRGHAKKSSIKGIGETEKLLFKAIVKEAATSLALNAAASPSKVKNKDKRSAEANPTAYVSQQSETNRSAQVMVDKQVPPSIDEIFKDIVAHDRKTKADVASQVKDTVVPALTQMATSSTEPKVKTAVEAENPQHKVMATENVNAQHGGKCEICGTTVHQTQDCYWAKSLGF